MIIKREHIRNDESLLKQEKLQLKNSIFRKKIF